MQVLCMVTAEELCDVQCPCCQQRYVVYYSRQCQTECDEALEMVRAALLAHHAGHSLAGAVPNAHSGMHPDVHPGDAFTVPAWSGAPHASAAAIIGGAPLRPPRNRPAPLAFVKNTQQRRVS